jgi:predicted Rossmann fold nucleotide-binding protein DprA/Smf involved in DNA uptake
MPTNPFLMHRLLIVCCRRLFRSASVGRHVLIQKGAMQVSNTADALNKRTKLQRKTIHRTQLYHGLQIIVSCICREFVTAYPYKKFKTFSHELYFYYIKGNNKLEDTKQFAFAQCHGLIKTLHFGK